MSNKTPLVTIVAITYNHAKYVRQAMDSFLAQRTDFGVEILVHDDASTDETAEILKAYKKKFPDKIQLLLEKENQFSKTGAKFLEDMYKRASGKYIAVCEGDDYWNDPKKLQLQVNYLEKNQECTICFHPVMVCYEDTGKKMLFPTAVEGHEYTLKELLQTNFIQTNSVMYRNLGHYKGVCPDKVLPQDWFTHIFHARHGKIGFINKAMSVYRVHSEGIWHGTHEEGNKSVLIKYGVQWLGMNIAVHEMCGKDPEYRSITEGNVINTFRRLFELYEKHPEVLLKATATYPIAAVLYVNNLQEQLDGLHFHVDKQAELIRHYKDLSDALQKKVSSIEKNVLFKVYKKIKKQ